MSTNWQLYGALSDGGSNFVEVIPTIDVRSQPNYVRDAGGLIAQTKAMIDSDLAHGDGTLAFVYGDPANNGSYIKSGSSGQGSWVFIPPLDTLGTDDANDRFVSADYTVEPGIGYVEADCTGGNVTITYDANNPLVSKKCHFRKSSSANAMIISDGVTNIRTEPSTNTIGYRRVGGNLIRL